VAESRDGIHFTRPKLGLVEVNGSKENNVVWRGVESHNFAPFIDQNPQAAPDARYKALAGLKEPGRNWHLGATPGGLYAFASADGLNWRKIRPEPVMTQGAFDSLNLAFWDSARGRYTCYSRIFEHKVRAVQSVPSADFITWGEGVPNRYAADVPYEHFDTSATLPCPGAGASVGGVSEAFRHGSQKDSGARGARRFRRRLHDESRWAILGPDVSRGVGEARS
jgi:hypothetical protein